MEETILRRTSVIFDTTRRRNKHLRKSAAATLRRQFDAGKEFEKCPKISKNQDEFGSVHTLDTYAGK